MAIRPDGNGYLVDVALEARLLGRLRLLTAEATIAVAEDAVPVLDGVASNGRAAPAALAIDTDRDLPPATDRPDSPRRVDPAGRPRLSDATELLRDARLTLERLTPPGSR